MNPPKKAHQPVSVRRRRAPPRCPPRPPSLPQESSRRPHLPSSTPTPGPQSSPSHGDRFSPPPSPSGCPPPPMPRRRRGAGCQRPTPSTTTRRWTRETRNWTGTSCCSGSSGRWRAPASWRRSGGGGGTRTRGRSTSARPDPRLGGFAGGAPLFDCFASFHDLTLTKFDPSLLPLRFFFFFWFAN